MSFRGKWKLAIFLILLCLPFIFGLFEPSFKIIFRGTSDGYYMLGVGFIYVALVALSLGVYSIAHFVRKKGIKGLVIGILIFLVLIPLVFYGTCMSAGAGGSIRELFFK